MAVSVRNAWDWPETTAFLARLGIKHPLKDHISEITIRMHYQEIVELDIHMLPSDNGPQESPLPDTERQFSL